MTALVGPAYAAEMARYNAWQNEQVFALCDRLGEEARRADRGLFFRSIHATLDHIAMVDEWILDRLETGGMAPFDPGTPRHETWADLKRARDALDARIAALGTEPDDDWFAEVIEVHSAKLGRLRRLPRGLYVMQMFNHQTHHRSQVTAALWSMGIEYGVTDIPFHPQSPY